MKYGIIRDRTLGGTPVWDIAIIGKQLMKGSNGCWPQYSVTLCDGYGKARAGEVYERFVNPAEIFDNFNTACVSLEATPKI